MLGMCKKNNLHLSPLKQKFFLTPRIGKDSEKQNTTKNISTSCKD